MTTGRIVGPDALRGVAALIVLAFHVDNGLAPLGGLAVDMFFILSGYILTLLYKDRLSREYSFAGFAWKRFVRLYPVFLVGAGLGFMLDGRWLAFLMIPNLEGIAFPGNRSLWSLPHEMLISLIFAAGLYRLPTRWLTLLIAIGLIFYAGATLGALPKVFGLYRVFCMFPIGILIARLGFARTPSYWTYFALGSLVLVLTLSKDFLLPVAFIALPLVMLVFARFDMPHSAFALWIGEISYPLYAVHLPMIMLFGLAGVPLSIVLAWVIARFLDPQARRLLSQLGRVTKARARRWTRRSPEPSSSS